MFLKLKEARTARKISSVRAFFGDGRRRGRPHPASLRSATFPRGEGSDCRKTLGELERAKALSNFNRAQRHVRWAREDFCGGKSHFPEQKSFPCSFCARKSERFQQKLVGVAVAGELAPPSTSLSNSFLTSCTFPRGEGFGDFGKKQGAGRRTHPLARLLFLRRNQFLPPRATVLLGLERPSRLGNRCSRAAMAISTSSWTSQGVNAPTVTMSQGRRVA